MITKDLLEKFLKENVNSDYTEVELHYGYTLNGSIIKMEFSYNPNHSWSPNYIRTETIEFELLDYITWIYNQK